MNNTIIHESLLDGTDESIAAAAPLRAPDERRIDKIRMVIVDNLIGRADDFSDIARADPAFDERVWLKRERHISNLAITNIKNNVKNLVNTPEIEVVHVSDVNSATMAEINPDGIVLSGTLLDFDYYHPSIIRSFSEFARTTEIPILGICGGHQLIGIAFGTEIITLDRQQPSDRRRNRLFEYQYRYVKVLQDDPILDNIGEERRIQNGAGPMVLRVWQNHGLMVDRVPDGFTNIASGYLCPIQMMVKRDHQLIYTVQFHIEKSFEDWNRPRSFWDHHVESRDGRTIFENFMVEALKHQEARTQIACSH